MALLTNRKIIEFQKVEIKRFESNLSKLANGDFNIDLDISAGDYTTEAEREQFRRLNDSLQKIRGLLEYIITDTENLPHAIQDTGLSYRVDDQKYPGNFRKIAQGINSTLNIVDDKNSWYEAIIDAVPFPIHVTDNDMNWTYMNKPFEKLMIEQGVVKNRNAGYGRDCSNAGANICNTEKCGIRQLKKGVPESYFDWCGMSCKQDTAYLKNHKGEPVGFVEVVTDLTSILKEHEYTKTEVTRLASNLNLLASGDLNLDLEVGEADKYTEGTKNNFVKINENLKKAKDALSRLVDDATMLSQAAIDGKLDTRADVSKHSGEYRKIVEGVNATLDTVVDKNSWYEAIIDAVPFPIHVTDNDMNWTYMNKPFEKLMIEQGVVKNRKSGYGMACSNAGANICNTEKCGICQLKKGVPESYFDWCGMSCKQDTAYLRNHKGEPVGFVEVVTDLTSILRVSSYTKAEVERLASNLGLLASGDLNLDLKVGEADKYTQETKENFEKISLNLQKAKGAIGELINDTLTLSQAAIDGKLDTRADVTKHSGDYRKIVEGVNATLDTVVDKNSWYEAIIDAVPFPIHVTDNDMNWTYMNKPFEKLMIEQGTVKDRKSGYGKACSNAGANICNTEKCGIRQLKKGVPESYFDWCGMSCKQDTAYLKNRKGEPVGFVEVVTDLTSILRVSSFTKVEVERLASNLGLLASGDLNLDLQVSEADKYTQETKENFEKINLNLKKAKSAIGELINDTLTLSEAAIEGKLSVRVDPVKHVGDYRKIVEGVNQTLDSVIEPVTEASSVLEEMAKGNLKTKVKGNYKGDHAKIKDALNDTLETLGSYVTEISHVLSEMANKNMVVEISHGYRGDFEEIKLSLNNIIRSLNEVLGEISVSADQVSSGSSQVANGAQALAQGATEQASSVEELKASLETLSEQTTKNAADANRASKLAIEAKEDAEKGNNQMQGLLRAMDEISEASGNISKIIKVIEDIAFQTNILSLNAAVEAARAGTYGKGFAVVANEVRNLASKSANAAKETTSLIEGSIKKAEVGAKIAGETAKALDKIVNVISDASTIVGEIAIASNEQARGIEQIDIGLSQVAQVTQENSATSEESAAASEQLSSQASMLKEMVGNFKLKQEESAIELNPEMLLALKGMLATKGIVEKTPPTKSKKNISLEGNFGKY